MARLHFGSALLADGWAADVAITLGADGRIARIERGVPPAHADERHAAAVPGLPNLHSHAFQRAMAGLAERRGPGADSFWSWRETMYRFALAIEPDEAEAVATLLYCEMLEAGFTRVGEFHYLHHAPNGGPYGAIGEMSERIVAAAATTGIGLTLLPVLYRRSGFGGAAPTAGQRRFVNDPDRFARLMEAARAAAAGLDGAVVGVAPHSLRAVTPEDLAAGVALAGDGPIHIHVAEQVREVEDCVAWSGARPVRWLLDHAPVDRRWCLIHATHMHSDEIADMAARGAVAGLCPITESNLGDGIFAGEAFRSAGGVFGVGSDSNVEIGAAAELRQLEYSQRLGRRARNVMAEAGASTGRSLFEAALSGGTCAIGPAGGTPGLAEGASADLVSLRAGHPAHPTAREDDLLDAWVFSAGNGLVDCVWARGVKRVEGGRHRARAEAERRYGRAMARLTAA